VGGPCLFKEYWGRPEATADSFDDEGLFKTGDVVAVEGEPPYFKACGDGRLLAKFHWGRGVMVGASFVALKMRNRV